MADEEKTRRPFESNTSEEEKEMLLRNMRKAPFESTIDKVKEYVFPVDVLEFAHGNIFDREPVLTEEEGQMALKRLKDEGYTYGD